MVPMFQKRTSGMSESHPNNARKELPVNSGSTLTLPFAFRLCICRVFSAVDSIDSTGFKHCQTAIPSHGDFLWS
jgi:hypothetical protein